MALTFYWRCEAEDFTSANGSTDYSAGDTTAAANNSITLDAAAAKYGSTGVLVNAISEYYAFVPTSIISPTVGCVAVAFRFPYGMGVGDQFFYARGSNSNDYIGIRVSTGGDEISLNIRNNGTSDQQITTSGANFSTNTWYFAIARWDQPNSLRYIGIYDTDGVLLTNGETTDTNSFTAPADLGTAIRLGDSTGWGSVGVKEGHFDNLFIGSAYNDPLEDNLTITSYAEYGAETVTRAPTVGALSITGYAPTVSATTGKLKLLTHPSAASASGVEGWVIGTNNTTYYGYFSGKTFEASLDGTTGSAVLLVPGTDISPSGSSLSVGSTVRVAVRNATFGTTMCDATVIAS